MPVHDILLLTCIVGVFTLFGGTLAYGSLMEWRNDKARRDRPS